MTDKQRKAYQGALKEMQKAHRKELARLDKIGKKIPKGAGRLIRSDTHCEISREAALPSFVNPEYREAATKFLDIVEPILNETLTSAEQEYAAAYEKYQTERRRIGQELSAAHAKRDTAFAEFVPALAGDFQKVATYEPVAPVVLSHKRIGYATPFAGGNPSPMIAVLRQYIANGAALEKKIEQEKIEMQRKEEEIRIAKALKEQEERDNWQASLNRDRHELSSEKLIPAER